MVAMIMMRTLHKDFNRYNDTESKDETQEETGWKMVHGDVFRAPEHPVLLASFVGSGTQVFGMAVITLIFACIGFLSPSNRGGLLTALILLYALMGSWAGYIAARLCKLFKHQAWKNAFLTGGLLPGTVLIVYLVLNTVQWAKQASNAVPFKTLLLIFFLWSCVSIPLVLVGAAIGYKRKVIDVPCKVNAMPRFVPEQRWYLQSWCVILCSGLLPFGAMFMELVFILSSFWQGRVYYVFGFLAVVVLILMITCAEVAIVMVYFQLCYDNYHWWWRSYLLCASSGLHLFLYSLYYLATVLTIRQVTSMVLYVGYMFVASYLFAVCTGTIGFFAAFAFVMRIYSAIKLD